ncbi:MAG: flagellar hook-associated protein FlgL [Burkholderiaceae bacterium]
MRIGTSYAQQLAINDIQDRQSKLLETQAQLSSGRRVNTPSDDPVAAAEAERLRSRDARLEAEKRAITHARAALSSSESALGDATDLMQSARETMLAAANGTASASDRANHGEALRQIRDQLLSVANRGDGSGGYLFGGQGSATEPIDATGTVYAPQAGTQDIGTMMRNPVSLDGRENFTAIRTPSGTESIFARLDAAIASLTNPATTSATAAAEMRTAIDSVDRALDRFGVTRTMVGERLRALDAHEQAVETGSIDNQSRLSELVDVDFAKVASQMIQHQTAYEAAMKSYAQIARMTLFDYF